MDIVVEKPWYQSKINWLQILGMVVDGMQVVGGTGLLPPGVVTLVVGIGTMILRQYSSGPIAPLFGRRDRRRVW